MNNIAEACLNGIEESFNIYKKWSGGEWLWNSPEYLITIKIAENISSVNQSQYITLEDNLEYLLNEAGAYKKDCIFENIRENGRSDIVLWWGNGTPRAIIEVKNSVFNFSKIEKDILRIQGVLKKESKIQFGIIAFYTDIGSRKGDAEFKLIKRIEKIYKEIKSEKCILNYRTMSDDKDFNAYGSVCLIFKK